MRTTATLLLIAAFCVFYANGATLTYPLKVAYVDTQFDCCEPNKTIFNMVDAGYNVIVLAFYQSSTGPADAGITWSQRMTEEVQISTMAKVHAAGARVLISLGGANDNAWSKFNPVTLGNLIANWALKYHLDGVDFDLEHFGGFGAVNNSEAATVTWFSDLVLATRKVLGPDRVISFAPLGPWFGPIGMQKCTQKQNGEQNCSWVGPSGGMAGVYEKVGDQIDYFFMQYYNQGQCYTTEAGLFLESGPSCTTPGAYYPKTSVKEVHDVGVPYNKIVIGKPVDKNMAGSGFVDAATLHTWIENQGKALGWNAGVGIWEWLDVFGSEAIPFLHTVYPSL